MQEVKIINHSNNPDPSYATLGSAGCDIRANEGKLIGPGEWGIVSTGLYVGIPGGYEIQIRPRSGIAMKHGVTVLNSPATIDSDFTGEIKVLLINHDRSNYRIEAGDRIAQMVLNKVEKIHWRSVDELMETERSNGGFGSTGIN